MSDPFLGIGGVDYATEQAKALSVNEFGEAATSNVIGMEVLLDNVSIAAGETEVVTIHPSQIPDGCGYVGIFIANERTVGRATLDVETTFKYEFGPFARRLFKQYEFGPGREFSVVRPFSTTKPGTLRLTLSHPFGVATSFSMWIVFYRVAVPEVSGAALQNTPVKIIREYTLDVAAGQWGDAAKLAYLDGYKEFSVVVNTSSTHNYSARVALVTEENSTSISQSKEILAAKIASNRQSDVFTSSVFAVLPRIYNNSSSTQTYTVRVIGQRSEVKDV